MLKAALVSFLALPAIACANALVGTYGHKYTDHKDEPVWSIKAEKDAFTLTIHGMDSQWRLKQFTTSETLAFWNKMGWDKKFAKNVECVGNAEEIFCKVPAKNRNGIGWLQGNQSDYFHFDEPGGVMEIRKLPK